MVRRMLALGLSLALSITARPAIWYVHKENTGAEDGTSWESAFTTIQPAIDAAHDEGGGEVWVAEGVYDEQRVSVMYTPPRDTGSLLLREGIHLYGGFQGSEEVRDARSWQKNPATIDGSRSRGGQPALHVVLGADNATLDGFCITGGSAGGGYGGGGMRNWHVSPAVANCLFLSNVADGGSGGAMMNGNACPIVRDCTFVDNMAIWSNGGAIRNIGGYSRPAIENCVFLRNRATGGGGGGAISNRDDSWVTVAHCLFFNNQAVNESRTRGVGGAISCSRSNSTIEQCVFVGNTSVKGGGVWSYCDLYTDDAARTFLHNCLFAHNTATKGGAVYAGGMFSTPAASLCQELIANNCTFARNVADEHGGALYLDTVMLYLRNAILWDNATEEIHEIPGMSWVRVLYCDVQGGFEGTGNLDADPRFVPGPSGTATALSYDGAVFQSVVTDAVAAFPHSRWAGAVLLLGPAGSAKPYYIAANDAQTLTVWGDATEEGAVTAPVAYEVWDYHLGPDSPCIDTGRQVDDVFGNVTHDLDGHPRPWDGDGLGAGTTGDGSDYDMGADEYVPCHSADTDHNWRISAVEVGRVVGFYNAGGYHVDAGTRDGYAPGDGPHEDPTHTCDYDPPDWTITAVELSRLVTFYNAPAYHPDPPTADGFAPDLYD